MLIVYKYSAYFLTLCKYFAVAMKTIKILLCLCTAFVLCSCTQQKYSVFSGYAQGGVYQVKANLKGISISENEVANTIDSLLNDIDFSISGYNRNSLLSRHNAGEEIVPDIYFSELIELSEKYRNSSDGAFDVYGAPLFDIWGFGFKSGEMPDEQQVLAAMQECKEQKSLNFNAIAQGYSCDVIARYLFSIGVKDMLVNIGEIFCSGLNEKGEGWSIGVDRPVDGNNIPGEQLQGIWQSDGSACGIVTSGNYRKFYIKDGRKYAHTIDTRTGYPVEHNLLSATIVAPTAAEADAIATACMVMGTQAAKQFINAQSHIEGYLISDDEVWASEGFFVPLDF